MSRAAVVDKVAVVFGLAPAAVASVAAAAGGAGWLPFDVTFGFLTLKVAWGLIWVGLALGLTAMALWLRDGRKGGGGRAALVLTAVLAPLAMFTVFHLTATRIYGLPPIHDTATDWSEPLRISTRRGPDAWPLENDPRVPGDIAQVHRAWASYAGRRIADINAEVCPGARTVPRLVPAGEVAAALRAEGVRISGSAPWRVEGSQESGWYGRERDIIVRMEPGATDVRVSERYGLSDFGDTCRLTARIVERLQTGR